MCVLAAQMRANGALVNIKACIKVSVSLEPSPASTPSTAVGVCANGIDTTLIRVVFALVHIPPQLCVKATGVVTQHRSVLRAAPRDLAKWTNTLWFDEQFCSNHALRVDRIVDHSSGAFQRHAHSHVHLYIDMGTAVNAQPIG